MIRRGSIAAVLLLTFASGRRADTASAPAAKPPEKPAPAMLATLGVPEAIFIAALALHDVRTSGRLHPATIWGGGFLLVCAASRTWMSGTHVWLAFARAVTS